MYCNACGKSIAEDAQFCTYCGIGVGRPSLRKKLMRSRTDRKVGGVCAGVGDYLDLDVALVRLIWAFATLASGLVPGLVVYILAWIIIPEEVYFAPMVPTSQTVTSP